MSSNAPAIVATPATPAARSSSRREDCVLRIPGAGRKVFARVSCGFWSSSSFFILHLPRREASIPRIRPSDQTYGRECDRRIPRRRFSPIASFRQEFPARPAEVMHYWRPSPSIGRPGLNQAGLVVLFEWSSMELIRLCRLTFPFGPQNKHEPADRAKDFQPGNSTGCLIEDTGPVR